MYNSLPTASWFDVTENVIRIGCRLFTAASLFIFAILNQLLVIYAKCIYLKMEKSMEVKIFSISALVEHNNKISNLVRDLSKLSYVGQNLNRRFQWMLAINYFLSTVMMTTSSYYAVEFLHDKIVLISFWEIFDALQFFARFWLVCSTVDNLYELVSSKKICIDFYC
jgi:hypothetical protein